MLQLLTDSASLLLAILAAGGEATAPPPLDPARVASLESLPEKIELSNPFAYAQLLLNGRLESGEKVDVTRSAQLDDAGGLLEINERGRIRPKRDGEGVLHARVGSQSIEIPVRIRDAGARYDPSFVNDVVPMIGRLGCNAGTCHGSAKGRNGFKLSLRGYDPLVDYQALTDDLAGRRFNRAAPEQSLFLLKPTASVPHEGGQRMKPGSKEYELLRAWVEGGVKFDPETPRVASIEILPKEPTIPLPGMGQQMAVLATFADGRVRDVTGEAVIESNDLEIAKVDERGLVNAERRGEAAILARYSGRYAATRLIVMGDRTGFEWRDAPEYTWIDTLVDKKLRALKIQPSELCTDAEFLRRAMLDLTGLIPTAREVRTFLLDRRDGHVKREELIERLIGSTEFVEHWTNKWSDLLQVNSKFLGVEGANDLREWIRAAIASDMPYDKFAAAIVGASGSTYQNPPAAYYKILRAPDLVMENTTQLFMGVRFSCNKCHDHPFERWTQTQHWQLAAYFAQVGRENVPGSPIMPQAMDNRPDDEPKAFEERVFDSDKGEVQNPNGNYTVAPAFPFEHDGAIPADGSRREKLTTWLTSPKNPYFAKSYVNRVFSYFLGVGLIEPVDDLRAGNPPTNPELVERLTSEFVASGFDVRALMRLIVRSRVYQQSLVTNKWNEDDGINYSHAIARRLPAETLFDAVHVASGHAPHVQGARPGMRADELLDPSVKPADGFLELFGRPARESACECERGNGVSLGQALNLVNGPTVAEAIDDPKNALADLVAYEKDPRRVADEIYLRFLSRPPADDERAKAVRAFDPLDRENLAALTPKARADFDARFQKWIDSIPRADWQPLGSMTATATGGTVLTLQSDGSFLASGALPDKDTYTAVAYTSLAKITGFRIEVLPDASLRGNGPGRAANGNFVLSELKLTAVPLQGQAGGRNVALQSATADFSQQDFAAAAAIDGKTEGGWAVVPQTGAPHQAVFECAEDVGGDGGTLLVFTLDQQYGGQHALGRFRIMATTSPRPVRHAGLADDLLRALTVAPEKRSAEQSAAIHRAFLATAPDLVEAIRLGSAQDLAWALATSPAFLFNR